MRISSTFAQELNAYMEQSCIKDTNHGRNHVTCAKQMHQWTNTLSLSCGAGVSVEPHDPALFPIFHVNKLPMCILLFHSLLYGRQRGCRVTAQGEEKKREKKGKCGFGDGDEQPISKCMLQNMWSWLSLHFA